MSYQSKLLDKFIESDNGYIFAQIDKSLYTNNNAYLLTILDKLRNSYVSHTKKIYLIKPIDNYVQLREVIDFDDSNKSISHNYNKTFSLMKPYESNIDGLKFNLNAISCEQIDKFKFDDSGKIKIQYSLLYAPSVLNNIWNISINFSKTINNADINLVEWYKNNIFDNFGIDNVNSMLTKSNNLINDIDINIHYCGSKNDIESNIDVLKSIKDLFANESFVSDQEYKNYIYEIAKYVFTDKFYLRNFRHKYGLKQLSNQVIDLNKNIYYNTMIHNIDSYYLTDKIDGQRCMIYISEFYNGETDIKIIADKVYYIDIFTITNNVNTKKITVFDAELLYNGELTKVLENNKISLFIFDIIVFENKNVSDQPFEKRLKIMQEHGVKISGKHLGNVKKFVKLTNNHEKEIKSFYNEKRSYEIDGLIFTPTSNINTLQLHNKTISINTNYLNMIVYKWKPIELLTIDFYIKKHDDDYILFSGINKKDFDKFRLHYIEDYKSIIPNKYHNAEFFPIQFMPSDEPYAYIFESKHYKGSDLIDGKVGEFSYDVKTKSWKLIRLRTDRDDDVSRGTYFGNYYKIAESIWNNIKNPLTIENLTSSESKKYFKVDFNNTYKAQRNFNSFVKSVLLDDFKEVNWIIDLASGKGQDLQRIANLNIKNGLFIDNDESALSELIERKYSIKTHGMRINTKKMDLTTDYDTIIKELTKFDLPISGVDVIICNFAFHYFTDSYDHINNIINLVSKLLKPNGIFMFTTFNGEKIFNKLNKSDVYDLEEGSATKYSIKKQFVSTKLTNLGQQIGVLLPFSNNEYYPEYLVNLPYILGEFEQHGFNTITSKSFNELLPAYKDQNKSGYDNLTDIDKEYTGLYQYNILQKIVHKTGKNNANSKNILIILAVPKCDLNSKDKSKLVTGYLRHINAHFTKLGYSNNKGENSYTIVAVELNNENLYDSNYNIESLFNIGYEYANKNIYTTIIFQDINYIPTFEYFYYYTYSPKDIIVLPYDHITTNSYKNGKLLTNGVIIINAEKFNKFPILESNKLNIDKYNIIFNKQLINQQYEITNDIIQYKIDKIEKKTKYIKLIINE